MNRWAALEGSAPPLGVSWLEEEQAYNFVLYSKHATGVVLLLYAQSDTVHPIVEHRLDHRISKSGRVWHCRLPASVVDGAAYYAYRVEAHSISEKGTDSIRLRSCSTLTQNPSTSRWISAEPPLWVREPLTVKHCSV